MSIIKQLLRLRLQGCGIKEIARQTGSSKNTVRKYLHLADSSGLSLEALLAETDASLDARLVHFQPAPSSEYPALEALKDYLLKAVAAPHVTRWHLWGEYRQGHPSGYGYTQFCHYLQQWSQPNGAVMHFTHQPADKLFLDFTGDKLSIVDRQTGEVQAVEVLVAVLGYSKYAYVEALASQRLEDFLRACENALHYLGGCPKVLVPDNLKAAVIQANRYEPRLNEAFADLANHYQVAVMPARPYKPRDKAVVENAVKTTYTRIFAPLRHQQFFSLEELNHAIRLQLDLHNQTPFRQQPDSSRKRRFEQEEKALLQALPAERYSFKRTAQVTVMRNCHVRLSADKHYYSVPYRYIGQKVLIQFTCQQVTVFHQRQSIACHQRDGRPHRYTTLKDHLPSTHQYVSSWSEAFFLHQAQQIDPLAKELVAALIASKTYPEQAYKSCSGVLALARKTEKGCFVQACQKCLQLGIYNYPFLRRMLENGRAQSVDALADDYQIPLHDNIRGAAAYQ